jgi:RNA polymerase sigma factor (sigma-70 family)
VEIEMIDMDSTENEESESARKKYLKEVLSRIIQNELTENQRQVFMEYHFKGMTIPQMAAARGVNKSTVSRTLRRAEQRVHRIAQYL